MSINIDGNEAAIARLATSGTLLCLKIMLGQGSSDLAEPSRFGHTLLTARALAI